MRIKIGLISDTHGWLDPGLADLFEGVDMIIHAGDIGHQDVVDQLKAIAPTHAVKGNIDGGDLRFLPENLTVQVGPQTIGCRHIGGSPKRPNKATRLFMAEDNLDIIIVGHSHIPIVTKIHGTLWINPGAAGRHGFHQERFAAFLYIDDQSGELSMERICLGARAKTLFGDAETSAQEGVQGEE